VKKIIYAFSFLFLAGAFAQVEAGPVVSKKAARVYYSSPIKEFRGVAMYQWKKYDQGKPSANPVNSVKDVEIKSTFAPKTTLTSAKSGS